MVARVVFVNSFFQPKSLSLSLSLSLNNRIHEIIEILELLFPHSFLFPFDGLNKLLKTERAFEKRIRAKKRFHFFQMEFTRDKEKWVVLWTRRRNSVESYADREKREKRKEERKESGGEAVESSLLTYYIRNNNKAMRLSNRRHFSNSNYPFRLVPFFLSPPSSTPSPTTSSLPGEVGRELYPQGGGTPCSTR